MLDAEKYWATIDAIGKRMEEEAASKPTKIRKASSLPTISPYAGEHLDGGCTLYRLPARTVERQDTEPRTWR